MRKPKATEYPMMYSVREPEMVEEEIFNVAVYEELDRLKRETHPYCPECGRPNEGRRLSAWWQDMRWHLYCEGMSCRSGKIRRYRGLFCNHQCFVRYKARKILYLSAVRTINERVRKREKRLLDVRSLKLWQEIGGLRDPEWCVHLGT